LVVLHRRRARVARDIVRAGHDVHDAGLQRDDVLPETHEHLRRCLPADAATDHVVREQRRVAATDPSVIESPMNTTFGLAAPTSNALASL
jgi:hypothetical protein